MRPLQIAALIAFALGLGFAGRAFAADTFTVQPVTLTDQKAVFATVVVDGQLTSAEQFGEIVLRASASGASVRLKDEARTAWQAAIKSAQRLEPEAQLSYVPGLQRRLGKL